LVGPFLEVVGLVFAGQFIYKRLLWKENRAQFVAQLRSQQTRIAAPEEKAASKPTTPETVREVAQEPAPETVAAPKKVVDAVAEPEVIMGKVVTEEVKILVPTSLAALLHTDIEAQFELLIDTIRTIRNLRAEASIKPGLPIAVILQSESDRERDALTTGQDYIKDLAKVSDLDVVRSLIEDSLTQTMVGVTGTVQVLIPLAGVIDIDALKAKLEKDLAKAEKEVQSFKGRLQNPKFIDQAPPEVVQGARETLAEAEKQVEILRDRLGRL
jgi:valyl-tRNA synthetase